MGARGNPQSFSIRRALGLDPGHPLEEPAKKTALYRTLCIFAALFVIALCTATGLAFRNQPHQAFHLTLYLLGIIAVSLLWGRVASGVATLSGMFSYYHFFVDPSLEGRYKFNLHLHNLVVFASTFAIAQLVAWLIRDLRAKTREALGMALEQSRLREEAGRAKLETEAERARNVLLSSVSHDLRTPLASIKVAAETLEEDGPAIDREEAREMVSMIRRETGRLDRMLAKLLDITRLEDSFIRLNKDWQSMEEIIGSLLTRLESLEGRLPISVDLPPELPPVSMDGVLIEQALTNLLENAVRHAPGTQVVLSASLMGGLLCVEVRDGGPGVPDGLKERIFDKFYRPPGSGDGGTGLGLAICRAIVQAHDGRIWVEDAPGGGAAFIFALPIGDTGEPDMARIPTEV